MNDEEVPARPMRRSKGSRPSDDQLLDGARTVFAVRGFTAAGMDAIADAAGCTKPTLYAHFPSKQLVYVAALKREAALLRQWLFSAYDRAAGLPAHDQVRAGMSAIFEYAKEHPHGFQLVFGTEANGHMAVWRQLNEDVTNRVEALIREHLDRHGHQPGTEVSAVAAMVVGTATFAVNHAFQRHRENVDDVLDLATIYIEHALRAFGDPRTG